MEEHNSVDQFLREEGAIQLRAALQQDGDYLARREGRKDCVEIEQCFLLRDANDLDTGGLECCDAILPCVRAAEDQHIVMCGAHNL